MTASPIDTKGDIVAAALWVMHIHIEMTRANIFQVTRDSPGQ